MSMVKIKEDITYLLLLLENNTKKNMNELTASLSQSKSPSEAKTIMCNIGKHGETLGLIQYVRNNM